MFILVCRYNRVFAYPGDDITLISHLSPETSAADMEIRWFRGLECIYLYKNGQVTVGKWYEGRVSLLIEELQRGNVSLLLRDVGQADTGIYSCQVISEEQKAEKTMHLYMSGSETLSPDRWPLKIAEQDSLDMEESVHSLELKKVLQKKEKELQCKIEELESTSEELKRVTSLLQDREADVDNIQKVANDGTVHLKNMASELEAYKKELESLVQKLQEKDYESKVLQEELQASAKAIQVLTVTLQEKELELEEEKKHQEEREKQLQTVIPMNPGMAEVPQGPLITEFIENTEEMLNEMYQNPKDQLEEIEKWIHKKRYERRMKEEEERTETLEQEFLDFVQRIKGDIDEEQEKIVTSMTTMTELEERLEHSTEEERHELEMQLKECLERKSEGEKEIERLAKEIDVQRKAIEEKHRYEVEEIREKYEIVSMIETETNLLKIILPDVQSYFRNVTAQLQRTFTIQAMAEGRIEAAGEKEPDNGENSCREEIQERQMSPIEEESSDEMLEEPGMDAEQVQYIEHDQRNDSCEEKLLEEPTKSREDPRQDAEMKKTIQRSEGIDFEDETVELEEHPDMLNGVMTIEQEDVQSDIEADE